MSKKNQLEEMQERLIRANELLRTVIDENPNIIIMKNWDGQFLLGNKALADLYGTTPDALVGKDDGAFNPNKEQVNFYLQNVREIMSQGETKIVMEESTNAATGETRYFQSIKKPLLSPDGSRQILVIANDVTALRRAKLELEESERRLQYVLEVAHEGIWDWDIPSGRVKHNAQWCRLLGLGDDYMVHHVDVFSSMLHEHDKPQVMEKIIACLKHGEPYSSEHRMHLADGRVIWVLDRGDVVERDADGKALRMIGSVTDISERKAVAAALEERESYLRATLDNFPFLIWLKDKEGRFLTVNRVFAEAAGKSSPDELIGLTDWDIWPHALAEQYRADDQAVMVSGQEKCVEEMLNTSNSEFRWIETYKHPVVSPTGEMFGTVGFARDVTERHEMKKALATSELRWQLALEGNNDGIWDWNLLDQTVFFSVRWKSMLGYQDHEIKNEFPEWSDRVHPDDLPNVLDQVFLHLIGDTPFYQSEHRLRCKDGTYKWVLDRGKAFYNEQGKPLRMVGSHTDITERRLAEESIQDRNEQLDAIFSLSPDGLLTFDCDGIVKNANPSFYRLTGVIEGGGSGLSESGFVALMNSLCAQGSEFPGFDRLDNAAETEKVVIHVQSTSKILEVAVRASKSKSVSRVVYFRDVTREWEVAEMKSEFLSTAAHELRTPVASIYGFAELLNNRQFVLHEQKEILQIMVDQSRLVNSIINELLDLARIEARKGKDFVFTLVDAFALCKNVVAAFEISESCKVEMVFPSEPIFIYADSGKVSQALNNVLSNAAKYSLRRKQIKLILLKDTGESREYCCFSVQDQGIGMTKQQQERVCERFYRADTSGKIPGTGLGMSIVKEIVDIHQGKIVINSHLGQGTTVSLLFPML